MPNGTDGLADKALTDPGLINLGKLVNYVAVTAITIVVAAMALLGTNYQNSQGITANTTSISNNSIQVKTSQDQISDLRSLVSALVAQTEAFQQNSRDRVTRLENQVDGILQ